MSSDAGSSGSIAPDRGRAMIRDVFESVADAFDQSEVPFFRVFGEWLVDAAALCPGERVLDIGAGRGAVTFPAAAAVGSSGRVVAIDFAPRMVELLQRDAADRGLTNVEALIGDGEELHGVDGPFDCIVGGFVIVLMNDPAATLRRYRGLLRSDGRVALSTAGRSDERWSWLRDLVDMVPVDQRAPDASRSGPFASIDELHALLKDSGFARMRTVEREHAVTFGDADHWLRWSRTTGRRAMWDRLPAERREQALAIARRHLDKLSRDAGGIELTTTVRITTAHRGAD